MKACFGMELIVVIKYNYKILIQLIGNYFFKEKKKVYSDECDIEFDGCDPSIGLKCNDGICNCSLENRLILIILSL